MKKTLKMMTFVLLGLGLIGCEAQKTTSEVACESSEDTSSICKRPGTTPVVEVNREGLEAYTELSENPVIQAIDFSQAKALIEKGTGVLALGFPSCGRCQEAFPVLDQVAADLNADNVYYLNVRGLTRGEEDTEYEQIIELLKDYMGFNDDGEQVIYVPDVFAIKDGEVVTHHLGTTDDHDAYERQMTEAEVEELTGVYMELFSMINN